jgi:hypothetical protein
MFALFCVMFLCDLSYSYAISSVTAHVIRGHLFQGKFTIVNEVEIK